MGKILLLDDSITDSNIFSLIGDINSFSIRSPQLRSLTRYFSALLISKSEEISAFSGDNNVTQSYMNVAASLGILFDLKSLQKLANENQIEFSLICFREPSFRAFIEKCVPDMMTVENKSRKREAEPPEAKEGTITRFPTADASLIARALGNDLQNR
jgi:hypothetical protein